MTRRTILWTTAALLGIAITAAVAWGASQLAAQRIGLVSAPLSVQRGLAPRAPRPARHPAQAGKNPRARDRAGVYHHTSAGAPPAVLTTPAPASTASPALPPAPQVLAPAPQGQSATGSNPPPTGGQDDGGAGSGNGGGSSGPDD